jgi:hypothetical protein
MNKENKGWRWRDKELSLKEFYNLPVTVRSEYISMLEKLSSTERSSGDDIILNQYSKVITKTKHFLSLDDID